MVNQLLSQGMGSTVETLKTKCQFDNIVVTGGNASYGATSDNKVIQFITFCFQWRCYNTV